MSENANSLNNRAVHLFRGGDLAAAEQLLLRAVELWEQGAGTPDPRHITTLQNLAAVARRLEHASLARRAYLQMAELERGLWPPTDPQRADALNEIAARLFALGDAQASEALAREALGLRRALFGENHPHVAMSINNLGHLRKLEGDLAGARALMQQALEIRQVTLPETHPEMADSWSSLASISLAEGDAVRAEREYGLALAALESHFGSVHPTTAAAYEGLAAARRAAGNHLEAKTAMRRAMDLQDAIGASAEDRARLRNNLADLHYASSEWDSAHALYAEAVELLRNALGENHPLVVDVLNNLANTERELGSWEEARSLYERALEIQRAIGGERDPRVLRIRSDLAELQERSAEVPVEQLLDQALSYERRGDLAAAQRLASRAVAAYRGSPEPAKLAEAQLVLGNILLARAQVEAARHAYEEGLGIADVVQDTVTGAALRSGLAEVERWLGHNTAAERRHREAIEMLRAAKGHRLAAYPAALHNLALALQARGALEEAVQLLEEAVDLLERRGDEDELAVTLDSLGRIHLERGDLQAAASILERALQLAQRAFGPRHPTTARVMGSVGVLDATRGDISSAAARLREALDVLQSSLGADHPTSLNARRNLANVLLLADDYAAAEEHLTSVAAGQRALLGDRHAQLGRTLMLLGDLYRLTGRPAQALPLIREGAEILRDAFPADHPAVGAALARVGSLYLTIGAHEPAEDMLGQALDQLRNARGDTRAEVASVMMDLVRLRWIREDLAGALALFEQALDVHGAHGSSGSFATADTLTELGALRMATGDATGALDALDQAVAKDDRMLADVLAGGSERARLAHLREQRRRLATLIAIASRHPSPRSRLAAFNFALRRKGLGAETVAVQREAILSGRYPELADILHELGSLRTKIGGLTLARLGDGEAREYAPQLVLLTEQREALERAVARRIPEAELAMRLRAADAAAIARALPRDSVLVEFVQTEVRDLKQRARGFDLLMRQRQAPGGERPTRYLAFVVRAGAPEDVALVDLGDARSLGELVEGYRAWLTDDFGEASGLPQSGRDAGVALRRALLDPLGPTLAGARQLFVAPDGDLARLPFEALPTGDDGYLIDRWAITYLSTGRDLLRFAGTAGRTAGPPVVVADPDFDLRAPDAAPHRRGVPFPSLSGTRAEGRTVAALLEGAEGLLGHRALESVIKARRAPRILHLATHGFFLPDPVPVPAETHFQAIHIADIPGYGQYAMDLEPAFEEAPPEVPEAMRRLGAGLENPLLRCGLALAGANSWLAGATPPAEAEDGVLTGEDIASLDLLGTELAVLSACDTGLGEVERGEGVFGLRRAFVLAGSAALVMSLWKVPDEVTAELMVDYYQRLVRGAGRGAALRDAQLAMRRRPGRRHPLHWAAFVFQGDPSSIPR